MSGSTVVKQRVRAVLPRPVVRSLKSAVVTTRLARAFTYDMVRYRRYSSSIDETKDRHNLQAVITERYHSLEKGMSLPAPRPAFGARPLGDVVRYLSLYIDRYGVDDFAKRVGAVLRSYLEFNTLLAVETADIPEYVGICRLLRMVGGEDSAAGTRKVRREHVLNTVAPVGLDFFTSRNSVRQFTTQPISLDEVQFAATAALHAPAVCNRQFGRIHCYLDRASIARILQVQGGANGFADQLSGLAIITTNLRSYWNDTQRNQAWVDGGLFAMNFILGLHAQGLGSVSLNWSKGPTTDQELRRVTGIRQEEAVVMLVGFGHLRTEYRVASSPRQALESVLVVDTPVSVCD